MAAISSLPSLIPLAEAAARPGISLKTAKNRVSEGRFPLASARVGQRRFVRSDDLTSYIDRLIPPAVEPVMATELVPIKRGPGRPRKLSQAQSVE